MENKLTPELIEKARQARSHEELLALAKENGIELSEDEAKAYFGQLNKSGELSDDELDNVSGGGCYSLGKRLIVTPFHSCKWYECKNCGGTGKTHDCPKVAYGQKVSLSASCEDCKYCAKGGLPWVCNNSNNNKK